MRNVKKSQKSVRLLLVAVAVLLTNVISAQRLGTSFLFKPSVHVSADFQPLQNRDGSAMGLRQYKAGLLLPVGGKVELGSISLKKGIPDFNLGFRQHFWNMSSSWNTFDHPAVDSRSAYSFQTGVTGIRVGITGVWLYGLQAGITKDIDADASSPWAVGGVGRFFFSLKKPGNWKFFGIGALYNRRHFLPFPVFGLHKKMVKKVHFNLALPLFAEINWKVNKKLKLELYTALRSFNAGIRTDRDFSAFEQVPPEVGIFDYTYLNNGLQVSYKFHKNWEMLLDGGYRWPARFTVYDIKAKDKLLVQEGNAHPYLKMTIRHNFGVGPLRSTLFGFE